MGGEEEGKLWRVLLGEKKGVVGGVIGGEGGLWGVLLGERGGCGGC